MNREGNEALLELLVHAFETAEDADGMVYLDIQKLFYHLRERLEDDNSVRELLPYYWYIDGTVSDTVKEAVDLGLESGVLESSPTTRTGSGEWYERTDEHVPSSNAESDDLETARRELERVLAEDYELFTGHEDKVEDVYEDAPYEFQRYFKLNILFSIDGFAAGRPLHLGTDNLASEIGTAEAYLPLEPAFEEFNRLFSRYVNTAKRYLDHVDEDSRELADRFKHLSESVWRLYCEQLRLLEHDPYYDSEIDAWEREYERTRQLTANDLVEFRRLLDEAYRDADSVRSPEDSSWGKIVADYLEES